MLVLGISAFYHDSAACLLRDGEIVAAAQEERFSRIKNDPRWPERAIEFCLAHAAAEARDLAVVAFYDKPWLKFERLLQTHVAVAPRGLGAFVRAMPLWLKQKLWIPELVRDRLPGFAGEVMFPEHHESHAASAFFPSPFEEAAVLTIDGVGEWATTSVGLGRGNAVRIVKDLQFPHSLGLLYSAFTAYTGFKVNSGEYKVMGLAPYGRPRYASLILEELVDLKADGSFRLAMEYFDYAGGLRMVNRRFEKLFGGPPREPESPLDQRHLDLAASIQSVCEEVMLRLARHAHELTGARALCMAGGVALNCVGNGRILREGPFERMWIQPASGDAGGAVGAALCAWHQVLGRPRKPGRGTGRDSMQGALLGPSYSEEEIEAFLRERGASYERLAPEALPERVAGIIAAQKVVGWFQGRMEFGPRSLGARSILADPRAPTMQSTINLKIKRRESFRPFAPSVLRDRAADYFELEGDSPYMLLAAPVRAELRIAPDEAERTLEGLDLVRLRRSTLPAVTHVDGSARIQTVDAADNPAYHALLEAFERLTGCPVLVNTSFNVRGEPIVCTPEDAYRCLLGTELDFLVLGPFLLDRAAQPEAGLEREPLTKRELD